MIDQGMIHNITVQQLPPTQPRPKKRLSHTVKAVPSYLAGAAIVPIKKRGPRKRRFR